MSAASLTTARLVLGLSLVIALFGASAAAGGDNGKPQAPGDITVTAATGTSISIRWSPPNGNKTVIGYRLYLNETWKAEVSDTTYTIDGLLCGRGYRLSLVAVDASNDLSRSMNADVATSACADTQPPTMPTGFRQDATTATTVVLSWNPSSDNLGVVGYGVYDGMLPVASIPEPNVTLPNLSCGTTKSFAIDAVDASGNRSPRANAYVKTSPCGDSQPPTAPTGLSVSSRTTSSLSMIWSPSSDNVGVAGYRLYVDGALVTTTTQPTTTLGGLACERTYTIGVEAVDAAGNRSQPVTVNGSTAVCPPPPPPSGDATPPTAPSGLAVNSAMQTSITLSWSASTDDVGVAGYGIYQGGSRIASTSQSSAALSGLQCGTAYAIGVDAYDAAGNRSPAAQLTASTSACPDNQPPTAPTNVTATSRTSNSIALSWSASTDNVDVIGYNFYKAGALVGTVAFTAAIYSGLTGGTNYTLAVEAFDAAGNRSPQTVVMVATTQDPDTTPPSTPTGLTVSSVTQTSLNLSWNAAADNVGVAGYDVFRNGTLVGTSAQTGYAFSGFACGTTYTLAVEAYDAAGNRSPQANVGASTAACAPPPGSCTGVSIGTTTDLQQAVNANPSGTTFCLSVGVHRLTNYVIPKSGDGFIGYPGAVLNGSKEITPLFTSAGSYWVASGQVQENATGGQCMSGTACQYPDDVFLDDKPLQRVLSLSELGSGRFYFDYGADRIYIGDNPAGHKVEAAVATRALKGWSTGADNVTISGLVIEKFANEAQQGAINGLPSWVVKNSEVRLNHGIGIQDAGTVVGNHVYNNGELGISGYGLAGALVEGNEIDHNNYAGFDRNWEAGGIKIAKTNNMTMTDNDVHDNDGQGLWCDTDCVNITYENNRVINNNGIGILHEMSFAATIRNNVVEGNGFGYQGTGSLQGAGVLLANSANVEVYGNSVTNNKDGMGMTQIDRGSGPYGYYNTHDDYFHDNTVTMSRGLTGLVQWEGNGIYYTGKNNRFQGNSYIFHCVAAPLLWQNPTNSDGYAALTPTQWRAAGNDTTGTFISTCP